MVVQKNGELIIRAEQIIDEAYKKGWEEACDAHDLYTREEVDAKYEEAYDKGYQRGLDDAWEAARKIVLAGEDGGLPNATAYVVFGNRFYQVFREMSVTEVIEKIRKYEQDHAPGCDNCKHKDDQFSVCSGCEDGSEYETETTEANCGECLQEIEKLSPHDAYIRGRCDMWNAINSNDRKEMLAEIEQILRDLEKAKSMTSEADLVENKHIEELELSVRSYNCLIRAGLNTIGKVIEYDRNPKTSWMKVRNLGRKSIEEIRRRMFEFAGYEMEGV